MNKFLLFGIVQVSSFFALLLPLINKWLVFIPLSLQLGSWIIPVQEIKRLNALGEKDE